MPKTLLNGHERNYMIQSQGAKTNLRIVVSSQQTDELDIYSSEVKVDKVGDLNTDSQRLYESPRMNQATVVASASVPAINQTEKDENVETRRQLYHSNIRLNEQIKSKAQTETSFFQPEVQEDDADANIIADEKLPLAHIKNMANTIKHAS